MLRLNTIDIFRSLNCTPDNNILTTVLLETAENYRRIRACSGAYLRSLTAAAVWSATHSPHLTQQPMFFLLFLCGCAVPTSLDWLLLRSGFYARCGGLPVVSFCFLYRRSWLLSSRRYCPPYVFRARPIVWPPADVAVPSLAVIAVQPPSDRILLAWSYNLYIVPWPVDYIYIYQATELLLCVSTGH